MLLTLDTNIIIYFLNGDALVIDQLNAWRSEGLRFNLSAVSVAEVLSYSKLSSGNIAIVEAFLDNFLISPVDLSLAKLAGQIRRDNKISLGDSLIVATALKYNSALVTNDRLLAKKASKLVEIIEVKIK